MGDVAAFIGTGLAVVIAQMYERAGADDVVRFAEVLSRAASDDPGSPRRPRE
ncbi:hypothetical protein ACFW9N_20230 [Streptomyces sp. NPDC059496]|uniref:hypothetical protein n=1 Tax=Streptomyces sp. NPDC059496 TaxID=3346851 RepID=UPI0036D1EF7E